MKDNAHLAVASFSSPASCLRREKRLMIIGYFSSAIEASLTLVLPSGQTQGKEKGSACLKRAGGRASEPISWQDGRENSLQNVQALTQRAKESCQCT
jgi:hypothetical protein